MALAIVAARAASHCRFPLATLAAELRDAPDGLDGLHGNEPATDIRTVFSWSYRTLSDAAAGLFRQLGLHPGPDITAPAAASLAGTPPHQVRRLLAELTSANLISEHVPGRYTFHDLLRAYATEQAHTVDRGDERRAALRRLLDHYLHTAHTASRLVDPHRDLVSLASAASGVTPEHLADNKHALAWLTAEHAVLLATVWLAARTGFDTHAWHMALTLAGYQDRQGHWDHLVATQHIALDAAYRLADLTGQAQAHRHLGNAYVRMDQLDRAHTHYRRAVDLFGQVGDDVGRAHAHLGINVMFDRQGRHQDALHHAQMVLDLFEAAGDRVGQAFALNGIGWMHAKLGDYRHAITNCQQALTMHQELGDRYGAASAWDSLGYAHHHLGRHAQAIACYRHALALLQQTGDRYHTAVTLTHLGDACRATGDHDTARDAWRQALTILNELGHPETQALHAKLAHLDRNQPSTSAIRRVPVSASSSPT